MAIFNTYKSAFLGAAMFAFGTGSCFATEPVASTPDFLLKFHFATQENACVEVGETSELMMNEIGIFGQEFGCKFLGFLADREEAGGEAYLHVATVNCGDDGGINRPDMITLIYDDEAKTVVAQSQNEFVVEEAVRTTQLVNGTFDPDATPLESYVSRTYNLCETN